MHAGRRLPYPDRLRSRIWMPGDFAFSPHLMGNSSRLKDEPETIFHQVLGCLGTFLFCCVHFVYKCFYMMGYQSNLINALYQAIKAFSPF